MRFVGSGNSQSQDAVIRTNGGTLTIDAEKDTVSHFGFATVVNCEDVKVGTYNENGTVGRLIYSDNEGAIYFGSTAVVYCYMNTSSDATANLSNDIKATKATIYTHVQSGGNAVVYKGKTVDVTNGLVDVSTCVNHNDDYGIIKIGDVAYVICKCCGGFSKYSVDSEGHLVTENGDGIGGHNSFSVDNSDLGLNVVEEPKYVAYADGDSDDEKIYYTSLDEYFEDIKSGGWFDVYLLCDVTENLFLAIENAEDDQYCASICLEGHTLSGNIYLNGTTLTVLNGTLASNVYLNETTTGPVTANCALHLGQEWEDEDDGTYKPVTSSGTITLNGTSSDLIINSGSSVQKIVNIDDKGNVYDYNN